MYSREGTQTIDHGHSSVIALLEKIAKQFDDIPAYHYDHHGTHHSLRKRKLHEYSEKQGVVPYYPFKLHLAINLKDDLLNNDMETFKTTWAMLCEIFRYAMIYEIKIIDPNTLIQNPAEEYLGNEIIIYFIDKPYQKIDNYDDLVIAHIEMMRFIDDRILELKLPVSIEEKPKHIATLKINANELGCKSGAIFISASDHHSLLLSEIEKYILSRFNIKNTNNNEVILTRNFSSRFFRNNFLTTKKYKIAVDVMRLIKAEKDFDTIREIIRDFKGLNKLLEIESGKSYSMFTKSGLDRALTKMDKLLDAMPFNPVQRRIQP